MNVCSRPLDENATRSGVTASRLPDKRTTNVKRRNWLLIHLAEAWLNHPPQRHPIKLMRGRHRQGLHDGDIRRAGVADELGGAVGGDLRRVDGLTRPGHDEGNQALAARARVRRADDACGREVGWRYSTSSTWRG